MWRTWTGDGEVVAHIASQENTGPWAKAGVMVRASMESGARQALLAVTPANGVSFEYRAQDLDKTVVGPASQSAAGTWVKLVRRSNVLTAYSSADGADWDWVGTEAIQLPDRVLVGLAVTSHDNSAAGEVTLDHVSVGAPGGDPPATPMVGVGDGLNGTYFDLGTGGWTSRIDPTVDFDWGLGSPGAGINVDNFGARWSGWFQAQYDEPYTIEVVVDDGARLWVDDHLSIDAWSDHAGTSVATRMNLKAGAVHSLKLEYYERTGEAVARLRWSSPSTPEQAVPQSQLYSTEPGPPTDAALTQQGPAASAVMPAGPSLGALPGRAPALSTLSSAEAATNHLVCPVTVVEVPGVAAVGRLGRWANDGTALYAVDRRGYLEFVVAAPAAGIYQIEIHGASRGHADLDHEYQLLVYADGEYLGRYYLDTGTSGHGVVDLLTPWLRAGGHRVRVLWDNPRKGRSFELTALRLQAFIGVKGDQTAALAWMQTQLKAASGLDISGTPSRETVITSSVSPACLEGRGGFLTMMSVQANDLFVSPHHGIAGRWYANVPLTAGKPTNLRLSYENGGFIEERRVVWQATDLTESSDLLIREGDTLLLRVGQPPAGASGPHKPRSRIQVDGLTVQTDEPGAAVEQRFQKRGEHVITALWSAHGGAWRKRSVRVSVLGGGFGPPPAAWVGRVRSWNCAGLPGSAVIESDANLPMLLVTNLPLGGKRFKFQCLASEPSYVVARLYPSGPILASSRVNAFRLYSSTQTDIEVVESLPGGAEVVRMSLVQSPMLPELTARVSIVVGGIIFVDGSLVKDLRYTNFNPLGEAAVYFLRPPGAESAVCHKTSAWQGNDLLGLEF